MWPSVPPSAPPLTCVDYSARAEGWDAVKLIVGVATGPRNRNRRDAIRATWKLWPEVGRTVVLCFAVGTLQVPLRDLQPVEEEAAMHRDILWLHATDGCVAMVGIGKAFAFWRSAPALFIAKADFDSFVHVPGLVSTLERLSRAPLPRRLRLCRIPAKRLPQLRLRLLGRRRLRPFDRYHCAAGGARTRPSHSPSVSCRSSLRAARARPRRKPGRDRLRRRCGGDARGGGE